MFFTLLTAYNFIPLAIWQKFLILSLDTYELIYFFPKLYILAHRSDGLCGMNSISFKSQVHLKTSKTHKNYVLAPPPVFTHIVRHFYPLQLIENVNSFVCSFNIGLIPGFCLINTGLLTILQINLAHSYILSIERLFHQKNSPYY